MPAILMALRENAVRGAGPGQATGYLRSTCCSLNFVVIVLLSIVLSFCCFVGIVLLSSFGVMCFGVSFVVVNILQNVPGPSTRAPRLSRARGKACVYTLNLPPGDERASRVSGHMYGTWKVLERDSLLVSLQVLTFENSPPLGTVVNPFPSSRSNWLVRFGACY